VAIRFAGKHDSHLRGLGTMLAIRNLKRWHPRKAQNMTTAIVRLVAPNVVNSELYNAPDSSFLSVDMAICLASAFKRGLRMISQAYRMHMATY
jgi:hypothetical protein